MRVRFSAESAANVLRLQGVDALKDGQEYVVLEVFAPHNKSPMFRLEFIDSEDPALFDSRAFTVTSSSIPPSWHYTQLKTGSFSIGPQPWGQPGFWEAFYDHNPGALETYEAEKRKILAFPE